MLVWVLLATLVLLWYLDRKKKLKLLQAYGYNVPPTNAVFGNLLGLAAGDIETQEKWFEEYGEVVDDQGGRIMGWYRGPHPAIWTTSPEFLKQVFIKDAENFIDRPMLDRSDNIPHLINLKGAEWKRARNTLAPTFTAAKMKKMSELMASSISTMIHILDQQVADGNIIDVNEVYQRLTLDTIGKCALAMKVDCQNDKDDRFLKMVRAALDRQIDTTVIVSSCFPIIESLLAWIFSRRGRKKTNIAIIEKCREVLNARKANPPPVKPYDALQMCIDAAGKDEKISEDEIVAHGLIFILAGYETTAAALNFTTYLLAKYPEIQEKLRQEILDYFKDGKRVDYDTVSELPYLDMVLNESMRIYPPIPLHVGRGAKEERTYCGKTIPKGTAVLAALWQLHHDPAFWEDPWKFEPERFAPENRDKITEMTYMPFGDGPRNCIGRRFALMEAKMALVEVLKKFRVSLSSKTPNPLPVRNKGLTLAVKGDCLFLNMEKYEE